MIFNLFRSNRLEDNELISCYKKKGEVRFVAELYQRYAQLISAVCLKYLKHTENAQDAAMDIFEIMTRDLLIYDIQKPSNWLYSITKNHCLKLLRKSKKEVPQDDLETIYRNYFMDSGIDNTLLIEEELEQELKHLREALLSLKEEQRDCVKLFYLDKKSYQEISDSTGYPVNSVKSHIQNGKRKLKISLEKRFEKEQ